jgi:hypothetical protein
VPVVVNPPPPPPLSAGTVEMPPPPAGMTQTGVEQKPQKEEPKDLRSKWFFATEVGLDAVDTFFGIHLGFAFPLGGEAARTALGFNLGIYYGNNTLIADLPILLSERIRIAGIRDLDIIIRIGFVPYVLNKNGQTAFSGKALGGLAFHFPFGSGRAGGMAGVDFLYFPNNGFVATPYVALTL